jgi:RNA polymerase sigma-70 factor (ECF subfamily)
MDDAEDLQAILETLRGNTDAFRVIVDHHGARIFRLARSFLPGREDAEEAAQEILFRAFHSLRTFRLDRPFFPWLYAIARNYLRSRSVRIRKVDQRIIRDERLLMEAPSPSDPQASVQSSEARRQVREAVASLPAPLRDAATLYYLEGMAVSQVAATLGVGPENVKSRLLRCRRKLRALLDVDATG